MVCVCVVVVFVVVILLREHFLPDDVSSLILDLQRDVLLPSPFLRVGLGLGLDAHVVLGVGVPVHGWLACTM